MTAPSTAPAPPSRGGRWIQQWDPEDETFWKETGEKVAKRNLLFSVLSEHIGFSIWTLWSVLVLFMGPEYGLTPADKFMLTSMVTLVGAVVRVPYTFAVAIFGGRNWTIISASLLLVPTVAAFTVMKPGTSFNTFLLVGLLAGIGGGNFASSMTNINAFFPLRKKGWALGLNAGGGNIGVPVIQLAALAIIGASGGPRVLLGIYIPLILVAAVLAAVFMDNIENVKNDTGAAKDAAKDGHTWIMSFLYIGTFGSFIGYSFAFGQVLTNQFGRTPLEAAYVTFIGPLLGSLIRPVGGALADKYGGAKITLYNYVGMGVATAVLIAASMQKSLGLFTVAFVVLFVLSGLGNGSTFKMIPGIFHTKALGKGLEGEAAAAYGRRLSGASMGLIGAVGALGGVGINLAFRQSFLSYGSGTGAFVAFLAFYAACFLVTWAVYLRRSAAQGQATTASEAKPQLSYAEV
ncbi:nitrate/nitrite transporter [Streptomyces canus]|uniref:Nitrate/nitrite transporter n=1 Tax=Streptomyces canus TaxID=58343 RepID=A0AAW8FJH6_9ACTN|nr:nitrate/nitrite transporter [Streptomyces canus]MDQ0761207.1 NNP family nitrate/nitrite transporter-like MFS transporter [Streptomyces canus]MDQ0910159.1 NNP family nitrate/nitrite transporter-like MFS transporter [Streptomyces canus]MDQ1070169.1 NNP family nitrate/nitrite transporter-like MFS transporter [Streptomyces canus]